MTLQAHSVTLKPLSVTMSTTPTSTITEVKVRNILIHLTYILADSAVYFIMQDFEKAIADYNKSTSLHDDFIFTHVQCAVAQYKQGNIAQSMAAFRRILRQFPERGEPSNY